MIIFISVAIFTFGLCIGSFLNCLVYRIEQGKSFIGGRSFCPKCKHKLGFWDLIPVLSFIMLRGRCRHCGKKISFQYPLVEITTGLILIFNFYFLIFNEFLIFNFYFLITIIYLLLINCLLIIVFLYDLKHYIIPDKIIYLAIGLAFLYRVINFETLLSALIAGAAASSFFFIIWLISHGKWMGFGDVKLAFFMGIFLGWPNILVALFLAFLIGSLAGLVLISLGRKKFKSEVPFGPFLIIGTFLALFWGHSLINWYLGLLS